jgi:hypothetical protein
MVGFTVLVLKWGFGMIFEVLTQKWVFNVWHVKGVLGLGCAQWVFMVLICEWGSKVLAYTMAHGFTFGLKLMTKMNLTRWMKTTIGIKMKTSFKIDNMDDEK